MLVQGKVRKIPFGGARARGALDEASWLSRVGIEKHGQPCNGTFIEFPFAAHVTNPGGEVRHHDQFFSQPGEISNVPDAHHAS